MKCESVGMGSDSVRQLCDSVDTQKKHPGNPHVSSLVSVSTGSTGSFSTFFRKKEYWKRGGGEKKGKERVWRGNAVEAVDPVGNLPNPISMRVPRGLDF